jgi:hypothetical protein
MWSCCVCGVWKLNRLCIAEPVIGESVQNAVSVSFTGKYELHDAGNKQSYDHYQNKVYKISEKIFQLNCIIPN